MHGERCHRSGHDLPFWLSRREFLLTLPHVHGTSGFFWAGAST